MPAKIILLDIETAPSLGYVWGKYDQNVIAFERHSFMLAYSWKVFDEPEIFTRRLCDYKEYNKDHAYDGDLVSDLWKVFDEADIIIAHNGDAFDIRVSNSRFAVHNLPPPSTYKTVDTLKIARKYFRFESNKLDDLAQHLELGEKGESGGFATWHGCMSGDINAWDKMGAYNAQDVVVLERVYRKIRGWAPNHPNIALYDKTDHLCPTCGGSNIQRRGFYRAKARVYQRFACQNVECGHWWHGPQIKKSELDNE